MPTLDATPKGAASNSYATVVEADAIMDERLYASTWTAATADDKARALIWATRILDTFMEWYGSVRTLEQALRWPRSGVVNEDGDWFDYDTIPDRLKEGTADLALALLETNRFNRPGILGQGIEQATVGPISITVSSAEVEDLIPHNVLTSLSPLGQLKGMAGEGGQVVSLVRT